MKALRPVLCSLFVLVSVNASALTLSDFLDEVAKNNQGYTSSQKSTEAGQLKSGEGDLRLAYSFFMNYENDNDKRISEFAVITGDRVTSNTFSFGFNKTTSFRL